MRRTSPKITEPIVGFDKLTSLPRRCPLLARSGPDSAANGAYGQVGRYADRIGLVCQILHHKLAQDDIPVERKKGAIGQ